MSGQFADEGDAVETWLITQRDKCLKRPDGTGEPAWFVINDLVNRYRRHADLDIPLYQELPT